MKILNQKYRTIITRIILISYLIISVGFVFHYHHINLSTDSIVHSENASTNESPVSGLNHNGFVCIIHSNFQSLHTAFQTQIFGCSSSMLLPVLQFIEIHNTRIEQLQHATANPLRAPPYFFC